MAVSAAALLKEIQEAQREVEEARKKFSEAHDSLQKARNEYNLAEKSKDECAKDVDILATKLDIALADVILRPEFFIEFQANIGCYQCYIHEDLTQSSAIPTLTFETSTKKVGLRTSPQHTIFEATLEHAIDVKSSSIRIQKDHIHLRIPLTTEAKENRKSTITAGMAARILTHEELEVKNYGGLHCRVCQTGLTDPNKEWSKALSLPSSNWLEMVDFWGAAEGAFEHIPRDGIHAAPGRVYVASAELLLHPSDLRMEMLCPTKASTTTDGSEIVCANCTSTLGTSHAENIRLFKHCIDTQNGIFASYTSDSVIVSQILEVIESDGFFRFDIGDNQTCHRLILQVLGWDATIQTSEFPAPQRVIKVMFDATQTIRNDPLLPSRSLKFSTKLIDQTFERLEQSSSMLPPSISVHSQLKMGYLFG